MIKKAEQTFLESFGIVMNNVDPNEYFKREDVSKMKRIKAKVEIKGMKKKESFKYTIDIVKFDNKDEWKIMEVYLCN